MQQLGPMMMLRHTPVLQGQAGRPTSPAIKAPVRQQVRCQARIQQGEGSTNKASAAAVMAAGFAATALLVSPGALLRPDPPPLPEILMWWGWLTSGSSSTGSHSLKCCMCVKAQYTRCCIAVAVQAMPLHVRRSVNSGRVGGCVNVYKAAHARPLALVVVEPDASFACACCML